MIIIVLALNRPTVEIEVQEKLVFMSFFLGAIVCMGLSFTFHTVCCHNNKFIGQPSRGQTCGINPLLRTSTSWVFKVFESRCTICFCNNLKCVHVKINFISFSL
jgi:adiponectin receptor